MKKIFLALLLILFCQQTFALEQKNCPDDKPIKDKHGKCHDCNEPDNFWSASKKDCERCPNRYFSSVIFDECLFKTCPKEIPLKTEEGTCYACNETSAIEDIKASECAKCPNRTFKNNRCILSKCPKDSPLQGKYGSCFACDDIFLEDISEKECSKCSGMKIINGRCASENCPADRPVRDSYGLCHSCKLLFSHLDISKEECAKCPERKISNGKCVLKECPSDSPMKTKDGECRSCDTLNVSDISKEECLKCPDRIFENNLCGFSKCPAHAPMKDKNGKCFFCGDADLISNISKEECAKCPNRKMIDGKCIANNDCPEERPLRLATGSCYSCDNELFTSFSKEDCARCPNREMTDFGCILKECPEGQIKDEVNGGCFKNKKLVIDETIQKGNEPKWDYLEKDIKCSRKKGCVDKHNKKINGIVKEDMFDFYSTVSYRNGEPNGITKFYTQQNEFIAQSNVKSKEDFTVPLGNENFRLMMEKVSRQKSWVLDLVIYLDSCIRDYKKGKNTCKEILRKEAFLTKGKTVSIKEIQLKGDSKTYLQIDLPVLEKKYYSEIKDKLSTTIKVKEENNHLILYYPDHSDVKIDQRLKKVKKNTVTKKKTSTKKKKSKR